MRARKNAEESEIRALIEELQTQKEEELRARMERQRLKKVLHGADQVRGASRDGACGMPTASLSRLGRAGTHTMR